MNKILKKIENVKSKIKNMNEKDMLMDAMFNQVNFNEFQQDHVSTYKNVKLSGIIEIEGMVKKEVKKLEKKIDKLERKLNKKVAR